MFCKKVSFYSPNSNCFSEFQRQSAVKLQGIDKRRVERLREPPVPAYYLHFQRLKWQRRPVLHNSIFLPNQLEVSNSGKGCELKLAKLASFCRTRTRKLEIADHVLELNLKEG